MFIFAKKDNKAMRLYISENNLANPDFDEDKLVFTCFKLEDLKGKE